MTSWVLFKFKSSKEPQRITFDGTGITVYELKREIINISGLGDGTDFDLLVYDEASNDEYDDDTAIVPRSSMVVARRLPAARPGHGKAARYVSGRMPVNAKNSYRTENKAIVSRAPGKSGGSNALAAMTNAQTEQEKIAAMFAAEGDSWAKQQQEMANAKPVFFNKGGPNNKKPNMPDRPLPPGYVCFRCTQKGHWIYDCPTNDDPNFDAKHRIKRTTGIPRSFMKRVDKADIPAGDQADDSRPNKGFMIDADGNRVMVMPDTASWEKFEARHKASAAKKQEDEKVDQELQELGFDCPIDHRLFVVPTKTPCCSKTYCHGCIEDALVNNDLACPNCGTENVLIDDLLPDTEIALKIKAWQDEKVAEAKAKEVAAAAAAAEKRADDIAADKVVESIETSAEDEHKEDSTDKKEKKDESAQSPKIEIELVDNRDASVKPTKSPSPAISTTSANSKARGSSTGSTSKKRPAEQDLKNDRIPTAPAAMRKQAEQNKSVDDIDAKFLEDMQKLSQGQLTQGVAPMGFPNPMAFPAQNGMMGMPNMMGMPIMTSMPMNMPNAMAMGNMNPMMGMPNMMGMPGMQNPMAMQANGWAGMGTGAQMGFQQQNGNYGTQYNNQGWQNPQQQWNNNNNQLGQQPGAYGQAGNFAGNQNGNNFQAGFNAQQAHGSDSPYFRQPVNPFRHQKQKRMRPSDYREL